MMATNSPDCEIEADRVGLYVMGKLRLHSKHDFLVAVSITCTTSRLTSSGPIIPRVVIVWMLSTRCCNLGTFLSLESNSIRLLSVDDLPLRRSTCAVSETRLRDPFSHRTTGKEHFVSRSGNEHAPTAIDVSDENATAVKSRSDSNSDTSRVATGRGSDGSDAEASRG
jgi:hypothetical protein